MKKKSFNATSLRVYRTPEIELVAMPAGQTLCDFSVELTDLVEEDPGFDEWGI